LSRRTTFGGRPWTGTAWKETGNKQRGRSKRSGANLTDDDLTQIDGRRDQLEGKIQERYGLAKDRARKDVEDWLSKMN
jgi:uncharacterized protein YjbJ (UPF0337 family)